MATTGGTPPGGTPVVLSGPDFNYAPDEGNRFWSTSPVQAYADAGEADPQRTGRQAVNSFRPDPTGSPDEFYWGRNSDRLNRGGVELLDGDGWATPAPPVRTFAPNPRTQIYAEPRVTSRLAPSSYSFTRPYDQDVARRLTGVHFSMADHRRTYSVLGMQPSEPRRNTTRSAPAPWDYGSADVSEVPQVAAMNHGLAMVDVPTRRFERRG